MEHGHKFFRNTINKYNCISGWYHDSCHALVSTERFGSPRFGVRPGQIISWWPSLYGLSSYGRGSHGQTGFPERRPGRTSKLSTLGVSPAHVWDISDRGGTVRARAAPGSPPATPAPRGNAPRFEPSAGGTKRKFPEPRVMQKKESPAHASNFQGRGQGTSGSIEMTQFYLYPTLINLTSYNVIN